MFGVKLPFCQKLFHTTEVLEISVGVKPVSAAVDDTFIVFQPSRQESNGGEAEIVR